ncbi:MDR family MFS transporter [Streptococcus plurextorum]|uniref:MDR family MFS transporter n=1 Tax=Streptococcus plurextorum TaxID=456876 RepID=UPI000424F252|nr:MFS transporter [Streptococcus plurextorum]
MKAFFELPKQLQWRLELSFLSVILGSAIFPFMSMYYVGYFGAFITGILVIVTQVCSFFAILYGGHLADSIGRKKVADLGNLGVVFGYILTLFANIPGHVKPMWTFVGIFIVEIMSNFNNPAYSAMIIDLTDEGNRRYVYTINYWLLNVAVMLGSGIAGAFYDHHFFELLLAMTGIALFTYLIMRFKFTETRPDDFVFEHGKGILSTFANYSDVVKDRAFMVYTAGTILFASVWAQIDNYLAVHYKTVYQPETLFGVEVTGAKLLSLTVLINTIMIVLFMTTANRLTRQMKLIPQLVLGSVIFASGLFSAFTFKSLLPILFSAVVYTIGEMINVPASQVLRAQMMDDNKIGSYSGFISIAQPLGIVLAGGMVSLSQFTGLLGVQLVFILVATAGIFLVVKAAKMHDRRSSSR